MTAKAWAELTELISASSAIPSAVSIFNSFGRSASFVMLGNGTLLL